MPDWDVINNNKNETTQQLRLHVHYSVLCFMREEVLIFIIYNIVVPIIEESNSSSSNIT